MSLRSLTPDDYADAMALYRDLVGEAPVAQTQTQFASILDHPGTDILGVERDGTVRAMVTLHILPNMTQGGRPYALLENVVTARTHRGLGLGAAVIGYAIRRAWDADAYKIMLLTGQEHGARLFYEKLGFTADEKWGMTIRRAPKRTPAD